MLEPAGLDRIVQSASGFVLLVGILAPPAIVAKQVMKIVKADESRDILRRVLLTLGILGLVLSALAFVPVPVTIKTACVIDGANKIRITASTPGFIAEVEVRDGSTVEAGQILARLENPQLEKSLRQMRLQEESVLASEAEAISKQLDNRIPSLRALVAQYALAVSKYSSDLEKLVLHAPSPGIVIAPDLRHLRGAFLREGTLVCEILPPGPLEAVVALNEKQAGLVQAGQEVSFRIHSLPEETWKGAVLAVSTSPSGELPHQALGQHAGGTVPAILSASNSISKSDNTPVALPSSQVFKARIAIENTSGLLRPGMAGRLKIHCGTKPLGAWLVGSFRDMLRSDFQL